MKIRLIVIACVLCCATGALAQPKTYDTNSVIITRMLEKDLFDANSVPFMQPLVTTLNSTSNSGYFYNAYVPTKVDKPYFRFSIRTMVGFVRDDQREYAPSIPTEKRAFAFLDTHYVRVDFINKKVQIIDTAGLAVTIVRRLFQKGIENGSVVIPAKSATFFGKTDAKVNIKTNELVGLLSSDPEFSPFFALMDSTSKAQIVSAVTKLPDYLTLPPGVNMNTVFAAVPQFEIGSLYGTELLLRYIPPVKWDTSIGDFSFYGIAVKHSLSQYFPDTTFHCALQVGYQGTSLTNTVGVTEAKLKATANFFDVNIHASKTIKGVCDIYTGIDYATVRIQSSYSYLLPVEVQLKLGLLQKSSDSLRILPPDPANGYPGDNVVQVSESVFSDRTLKWTIGASRSFGHFAIFVDYAISKFNILSAGLGVKF